MNTNEVSTTTTITEASNLPKLHPLDPDKKVHPTSSLQEEPDFFKSSLQEAEASDLQGDCSTTSNEVSYTTTITKANNLSNLSPLYPYSKVSSTAIP